MHWVLVISAVAVSWLALSWIAVNVVVWLFEQSLFPIWNPYMELLLRRSLETYYRLHSLFSPHRKIEPEP